MIAFRNGRFASLFVLIALLASCGADPGTPARASGNSSAESAPGQNHEAAAPGDSIVQEASLEIAPELKDPEERENLSGAACSPIGTCLLIGDEKRYARFFTLRPQALVPGEELFLLPKFGPAGEKIKESDGEGIAFDSGFFYLVGSHSNNKKAETQPSRHFIARIAVDPKSGGVADPGSETAPAPRLEHSDLDYLIGADPLLEPYIHDAPGEPMAGADGVERPGHGLNIEGLAVRGDTMWIGFRGPVDAQGAILYELPVAALFSGDRPKAVTRRLRLDRGGGPPSQGIRDLAATSDGLLILAGPEARAPAPRPELWYWTPKRGLSFLGPVSGAGADSPEAIALLAESGREYRLLLLSDGANGSHPLILRVRKP